ncbi:MAG: sodium-translocating pyrophosphatase [Planctomycetota bacterium]|jgi:inorganic pyrophosphatase/K(+)-stimulated pyrophosphate-energized sodium pump
MWDKLYQKFEPLGKRVGLDLSGKEAFALSMGAVGTLVLLIAGIWIACVKQEFLFFVFWFLAFAASVAALLFAWRFFRTMMEADEGTPEMIDIAASVREGANAYLKRQYSVVALFFVVICVILIIMAYGLHAQSQWVPFAFLTGGFFSGLAGWMGMKTATWASSRTTAGAQKSLNQGLQVAFRSGAVMGLTVVGLGLLDIALWFFILHWFIGALGFEMTLVEITVTMLCFGMGASSQALFARVGGGIFTKAADVGADLVGKVEAGIPEDDKRNPATIADNVGDNVGDVAGMGADLYESYCGSILATAALGVAAFASGVLVPEGYTAGGMQLRALFLPMVLAAVGIAISIWGIYLVRTDDDEASQKTLLKALRKGIWVSTGAIAVAAVLLTLLLLGPAFWMVSASIIVGLLAGVFIGTWTEYSTSDEYKPTKELADQALTGPATLVIGGIADGMKSVWFPVITVCVAMILAFGCACQWHFGSPAWFAMGLYGVGIAAVGMLSTLGITLATDAYGPIADNAGGNAEMAGLDPEVRKRTDALDALGNTTAATGKGFAIGSAALTALALLAAYIEEVRVGFDRWGESALESVEEPGYYKISGGFIAHVAGPGQEGEERVAGYLAFSEAAKRFAEVDASQGPVKIPESLLGEGEQATAGMVAVKAATMPDFMLYYRADLMNPFVLVGVFLGAMATFAFCSLTMKAVGRAAKGMVEEVRRQFREKPGIMAGTEKPDYANPVRISTVAAQKEMIIPSVLGLLTPIVAGLVLGVPGVVGLLVGALTCGFCLAVFMANAGGSWDNAKKFIEAGAHGGKGTEAHKAAVVGDTVGDPFKDTSGPSLNILIKLMSMVSVVAAGMIVMYGMTVTGFVIAGVIVAVAVGALLVATLVQASKQAQPEPAAAAAPPPEPAPATDPPAPQITPSATRRSEPATDDDEAAS